MSTATRKRSRGKSSGSKARSKRGKEQPKTPPPQDTAPAGEDASFLRRIRLFSLIQFGGAGLLSIFMCTGRIMLPATAVQLMQIAWLILVLPSFLCAVALLVYHAFKTKRALDSYTGEMAFWSVAPATAAAMLWMF